MYPQTPKPLIHRLYLRVALLAALILCLPAHHALAQIAGTGSIQGTVTDPSGAVIPNATVTITEDATHVAHTAQTDGAGLYNFPNISIGTYTLSITASGFQTYVQTNVVLEVGSSIGVNVKMTVGSTTEKVEVHAEGIALQTEDASFKQTVDSKTVTEMPLNGRHMTDLITLSGAATQAPGSDMVGSKNFPTSVAISIAGGAGNETTYRLDGGDNMDYMTNVNLPFPFPDAVNQFSVESTVLGANGGEHPGGLVNVVTKSGTNQFHGDAFIFIRNNYLDATNFFATSPDQLHQDEFGGTIGGPIKRDKLFFFAGYQRFRLSAASSSKISYVPTAANLAGDFSVTDSAACTTKATQLVNPLTGQLLAGNKISTSYFDPAALKFAQYLPTASADQCGQVHYSVPTLNTENQFVTREDWNINSKHSFYGRLFWDGYLIPAHFDPHNVLVTTSAGNDERVITLTLGETWIVSNRMVNSLHATGLRRRDNRGPATGINAQSVGVKLNYDPSHDGLQTSVSGKWSAYCGTCAPAHFNDNTFAFADDINLTLAKHQLVFGGELVRNQLNISNQYETNGTFSFSGQFSQFGPSGSPGAIAKNTTGIDANLDFLTGSMSGMGQSKTQQNALRGWIPSLYLQDTYHASTRLTVTAGVRWVPEFEPVDYFNRGAIFNYQNFLSNTVSSVFSGAPAGTLFYGDKGVSRQFMPNHPWQFSPNLGFAVDPTGSGRTVFRGGAELAFDEPNFFTAQRVNQNPPFATATQAVFNGAPIPFSNPYSATSSIPVDPYPLPFKPSANTVFPAAAQYIVVDPKFRPSYTIQWTASVQHQFGTWQFQMQYIGNKSDHMPMAIAISPAVYIPGTWTGPGSCGALTVSPGTGKLCSTTGNQTERFALTLANPAQGVKYSGGGGGSNYVTSNAMGTYNAFVTSLQHRASKDFTFLANYTWSKCLNEVDASGDYAGTTVENPANPRLDYGPCGSDVRHVFNSSVVALSNFQLTGWKSTLLNNWQLAPLFHITSGTPFTVTSGQDNSLTDIGHDRPNLVNPAAVYTGQKLTSSTAGNRYFLHGSAFAENAQGTYGNVGRNEFFGPKRLDFDAEVSRLFPIRERVNLDFRLEAFNVLNHPNFNNPNANLNSSTFGQITGAQGARVFQGAFKILF